MKKILYLVLILFCSCSGQEKCQETEKIDYFNNKKIMRISHYCEENLNGHFLEYYANGYVNSEGDFNMNKPDGEWKSYHKNGRILSIINYDNGELLNINAWDLDSNQTIIDGTGTMSLFNINGVLLSQVEYKNSKAHGKWIYYYDNGNIQSELYYDLGKAIGTWFFYKKDGTVQRKKKYE